MNVAGKERRIKNGIHRKKKKTWKYINTGNTTKKCERLNEDELKETLHETNRLWNIDSFLSNGAVWAWLPYT